MIKYLVIIISDHTEFPLYGAFQQELLLGRSFIKLYIQSVFHSHICTANKILHTVFTRIVPQALSYKLCFDMTWICYLYFDKTCEIQVLASNEVSCNTSSIRKKHNTSIDKKIFYTALINVKYSFRKSVLEFISLIR